MLGLFRLRGQLFGMAGIAKAIGGASPNQAAATAAATAATGALATAQTTAAAAATTLNTALAAQADALFVITSTTAPTTASMAALSTADAAVATAATAATAATDGLTVAETANTAAAAGAAVATDTLAASLWALLAPLLPVIAAIAAVAIAVMGTVAAFKQLMAIAAVVERLLVSALRKMRDAAIWLGQQFVHLGEVVLRKTMSVLWEFAQATVDALEQAKDAVVDFSKEAADQFAEFEQNIANAVAITGKVGPAAMEARRQLMDFSQTMAVTSRYGAGQFATALYEINSAVDFGKEGLIEVTKAATTFAAATVSEVTPAAEMLTSAINAFGLQAKDAAMVADVFTQAINKSPLKMSTLTEALKYSMPYARAFGVGIKEMTAGLEAFALSGLRGAQAGTSFRAVMNALVKESKKATDAFKAVGADVAAFNPLKAGGLFPAIEQLKILEQRLGKMKFAELLTKAFPEARAKAGLFILLATGPERLRALEKELGASGIAAQVAAENLNTLAGAALQLKNVWENAKLEVGRGGLAEGLRLVVYWLREVVLYASRTGVFAAWGAVLKQVGDIAAWLVRTLGGPLVDAIKQIEGMLPSVVAKVGKEVFDVGQQLKDFVATLPGMVGGMLDKIGPAIAKFAMLWKLPIPMIAKVILALVPLPLLLKFVTMALPIMVDIFTKFVEVVTGFLSDNGENLIVWFEAVLRAVLDLVTFLPQVLPVVKELVTAFVQLGPLVLRAAIEALPALLQGIKDIMPWIIYLAKNGVTLLLNAMTWLQTHLSSRVIPLFQKFLGLIGKIVDFVVNNWPQITKTIELASNTISLLLTGLGGALDSVLSKIKEYLNYLATDGKATLLQIIDLVRGLINLLATKLQIDIWSARVKIALAIPFAITKEQADALRMQYNALGEAARAVEAARQAALSPEKIEKLLPPPSAEPGAGPGSLAPGPGATGPGAGGPKTGKISYNPSGGAPTFVVVNKLVPGRDKTFGEMVETEIVAYNDWRGAGSRFSPA